MNREDLTDCERLLLSKLRFVREIIQDIGPEDTSSWDCDERTLEPLNYSYEDFCNDLDVGDVYTRRLIELLVRETAAKRRESQQADANSEPRGNYVTTAASSFGEPLYVETLEGVAIKETTAATRGNAKQFV
jgi:hypothetical protein